MNAAQQQIREGFRAKSTLPATDPAVEPAIRHAEEVAQFLRTNVVQGKKEGDRYSEYLPVTICRDYILTGPLNL